MCLLVKIEGFELNVRIIYLFYVSCWNDFILCESDCFQTHSFS